MPIDDQPALAAGSAALAAAYAGPDYGTVLWEPTPESSRATQLAAYARWLAASGKKLEVPVRKILLGTPLEQAADPDSLANPEVLKFFAPQEAG